MVGVDDGWSAVDPTKNVYSTATPNNSPHLFGGTANPAGWVNLHAAEEAAIYNAQVAALTGLLAAEATARAGREAALAASATAAGLTITEAAIRAAAGGGVQSAGLFGGAIGAAPAGAPKPITIGAAVLAVLWWLL